MCITVFDSTKSGTASWQQRGSRAFIFLCVRPMRAYECCVHIWKNLISEVQCVATLEDAWMGIMESGSYTGKGLRVMIGTNGGEPVLLVFTISGERDLCAALVLF